MARTFDRASEEGLEWEGAVAPVNAFPFAMSVWVQPSSDALLEVWFSVGNRTVGDSFCMLITDGTFAGDPLTFFMHDHGGAGGTETASARTGNTYAVDTWQHCAGVGVTGKIISYLDGDIANKGVDDSNVHAPNNWDSVGIGTMIDSTPNSWADGQAAWAALWDLTDWGVDDAAREAEWERVLPSMAAGVSPLFFPRGLRSFWPLGGADTEETAGGGTRDILLGRNMVAAAGGGPDLFDHPGGLIYPAPAMTISAPTPASPPGPSPGSDSGRDSGPYWRQYGYI